MPRPVASAVTGLLHRLDPERAHAVALWALRLGLGGSDRTTPDPILCQQLFGLEFSHPIGLAAGFDKNGVALGGLARLGFGFLEVGTLTLRPQPGNPRPRLFRLREDGALINRMGFPNTGLEAFVNCLHRPLPRVPVGINIGPNHDSADPTADLAAGLGLAAPHADYMVINLSSPNTRGLRAMQERQRLTGLLMALLPEMRMHPRLLLKIDPDMSDDALADLVDVCQIFPVAGLIVANTTVARDSGLRSALRGETGGLSGRPLFDRATAMLARVYQLSEGQLPLIGVGGVASADDVFAKIAAGASLVQLYTSFIYQGPGLLARLKAELAELLHRRGFMRLSDAVGSAAARHST